MTTPAIVVDHVSKKFKFRDESRNSLKEMFVRGPGSKPREFLAVDDVSFVVERGKTFGLVGHNGSGKSTMLKMLAGVYRPTSGSVLVNGKVSALLELGAGFHGELTGRENIRLNGAILGFSAKKINETIDEIVDFADIGDFIDVPVKVYSSGMYVRLGFAIAVMLNPEILIVDEIIAVGDEEFQRKCFDYLYKLRREGSTIALVTHALGLARELCDEGIWMDHGHCRSLGTINDVIDSYLLDVNAREQQQLESADATEVFPLDRQGSGEVRIKTLQFIDESGNIAVVLHPGESYVVRLQLEARTDVEDVGVGVAVNLENGMMLAGPNSDRDRQFFNIPRGESFIDFRIGDLLLQPGVYFWSASLGTKGHVWDYVDKAWKTVVRSDLETGEPGPVRMIGRWSSDVNDALG